MAKFQLIAEVNSSIGYAMRRLPPFSALRAFEAAARNGSFRAAAKELGVTPTAISHQIRSLENYLATALFERGTRKVTPTRTAATLYPVLRDGFDAFAAVIVKLSLKGRPVVTISATVAFTGRWLVPRVHRFVAGHPGIDLRLHASDNPVDLRAENVDLAIRYGRGPFPDLEAEVLIADTFAPVASPSLRLESPEQMARLAMIEFDWRHYDPIHPTWTLWAERAGLPLATPASRLHFSDESHAIQAAVAGQGVALLSLALIADEIEAGRLVQPFGPHLDGPVYYLVSSTGRPPSTHLDAVGQWLREEVKQTHH